MTVELNSGTADLIPTYAEIIKKVREVVKMFKKSPLKNSILQKYVQEEFGKDLQLISDCKTR